MCHFLLTVMTTISDGLMRSYNNKMNVLAKEVIDFHISKLTKNRLNAGVRFFPFRSYTYYSEYIYLTEELLMLVELHHCLVRRVL